MLAYIRQYLRARNPARSILTSDIAGVTALARRVAHDNPYLAANGIYSPDERNPEAISIFPDERRRLLDPASAGQFELAVRYLLHAVSDDRWRGGCSYALKHAAETYAADNDLHPWPHIPNGVVIAAALAIGLDVAPKSERFNAMIGPCTGAARTTH
jgi:hypothetical protein